MTPEEHRAEAERLVAHALDSLGPDIEGGYDDSTPPSVEELEIRQHVMDSARKDAMVFIAAAQVHATLATYIPPTVELVAQVADWVDVHGDTWREVGDGKLRLIAQKSGACYSLGMTGTREEVTRNWGPLVPAAQAVTQ